MADYDAIVIGSGAGGLTAAVALARAGKKVIVFEQHYLPGGWCHSFNLEGYQFSPGVHYIGGMEPGGMVREIWEGLGVANDLPMLELNPDGFDHVIIGNERFDIPRGKENYAERLKQRFPKEAAGIDGYLNAMERMSDELKSGTRIKSITDIVRAPFRMRNLLLWGLRPLDKVLDRFTQDPLLRAILSIQAGDHGMPASIAPAALHASVVGHYFDGGFYPKGGARSIPKAFIKELRRNGGQIKVRTSVDRILLDNHTVTGVRLADGTEVSAPIVISNADPHVTFERLIGRGNVSRKLAKRLDRTTYSISGLSLFMAADFDVHAAGLDSGNYWYSRTPNIEEHYKMAKEVDLSNRTEIPGAFLTCTTLKDPSERKDNIHTFESFSFVSYEAFRKWEASAHRDRPEAYSALKARLTDAMLDAIDAFVPGLRDRVVFSELGSPLTNKFYANGTQGNLYGTEKRAGQLGPFGYPLGTEFKGLYLCGASTLGHGVAGATLSGLFTATKILGVSKSQLLDPAGQTMRFMPCDHPERWPEDLRPKALRQSEVSAA